MSKIRAVLDTNILISAFFFGGKPADVVKEGLIGKYVPVTSKELLEELAEKLKNKFKVPDEQMLLFMDIIFTYFHIVPKTSVIKIVRDPSDNKVIETAVDGKAQFIVTGDPDILDINEYKGIRILTPNAFLGEI